MDILLITTTGHIISSVIFAVIAALVLLQNPQKTLNRTFFASAASASVFGIGLAVGINLDPSPIAYRVWMVNLIDVVVASAYLHLAFAAVHKEREARWLIRGVYAVGALIIGLSLLFPHFFLPEIVPKLFTKSYLTAGPLYFAMFVYFAVAFLMALVTMVYGYVHQRENRRQLEYFILASVVGYSTGPLDFLLVFNIPVSPLYGMFFGLFMVPIAYGILADKIADIRVVIKRALVYSIIIGAIAAFLFMLIFLNDFLVRTMPWIQFWTIPIFTAATAFIIGRMFWLKSVETDRLKYEFITVAAHKLRTPLTQISWGVRELIESTKDENTRSLGHRIQQSTNRLIELTNIIFETTQENIAHYSYNKENVGLVAMSRSVIEKLTPAIERKHIRVNLHIDGEVYVATDARRLYSVIEVLLENAISYTPDGGFMQIIIYNKKNRVIYSVRDSGIGVSPEERKRIFSRFYRTDAAKRVDTEGVGLGLAMAKNIIEKQKGKIGVESQGEGFGSIFWFSLPKT